MHSVPALRAPRYSQALERGLAILNRLTPDAPVLGNADFADQLGMSRPTTHRFVRTLTAIGYLEQTKQRKYRLALPVFDLGLSAMTGMGTHAHAEPLLHELHQRTGYTTGLAVLDGDRALYLERSPSHRRDWRKVDPGIAVGSRQPLHCTATGKLLLAMLYDEAQTDIIHGLALTKHGPNSIRTKKALRTELTAIHRAGLAISDEELAAGVIAVAAPLRDASSETVATIILAASKATITTKQLVVRLSPHLISTADRISACLGYRRTDEPHGIFGGTYASHLHWTAS